MTGADYANYDYKYNITKMCHVNPSNRRCCQCFIAKLHSYIEINTDSLIY